MATVNIGTLNVTMTGNATQYIQTLNYAQAATRSAMGHVTSAVSSASVHASRSLLEISQTLSEVGQSAIEASNVFEISLAHIVGLVGISKDQVRSWGEEMKQMAPLFAKTPEELAKGMYFVTSGGLRGKNALEALTISAKAAAAGLGEVKTVANAIKSAVNAYGKENISVAQAADTLTAAIREGKMETTELVAAIPMVLPLAKSMKVDFYEVAGAMSVMTRTGTTARQAGVALQAFLSSVLKPTEQANKELAKYGLTMKDVKNIISQPGGVITAYRVLDEVFGANDESMGKVFANIRALRAILNPLAQDTETVNEVMRNVRFNAGAVDAAFQAVADTTAFKMQQALRKVHVLFIDIGDAIKVSLLPALEIISEGFSDAAAWVNQLSPGIKAITVFSGAAFVAMTGIGLALRTALFLVTPLTTAIALLAAGIGVFIEASGGVTESWKIVKSQISSTLNYVSDSLLQAKNALMEFVNTNKEWVLLAAIIAARIIATYIAYKLIVFGITLTVAAMNALGITQAIIVSGWIVYYSTLVAIAVVTGTYNTLLYGMNAALIVVRAVVASLNLYTAAYLTIMIGVTIAYYTIRMAAITYTAALVAYRAIILSLNISNIAFAFTAAVVIAMYYTLRTASLMYVAAMWLVHSTTFAVGVVLRIALISITYAIYTAAAAFRILRAAMIALGAVTKVTQLLYIGWLAVVIATRIVIMAIVAPIYLAIVAIRASGVALVIWNAIVVTTKAIMSGLIVVIAIMNAAFAAASIASAIGTFIVLAAVIVPVVAAISAAWSVTWDLLTAFANLSTSTGLLKSISNVFVEWYEIIKEVVIVAQTNMPLAWKLLKAGFTLAVEQVKVLWPPLWSFVAEGATLAAQHLANQFGDYFQIAFSRMGMRVNKFWNDMGFKTTTMDAILTGNIVHAETRTEMASEKLKKSLAGLVTKFDVKDSDAVKNARAEVDAVRAEIAKAVEVSEEERMKKEMENIGESIKKNMQQPIADATKEIHKFDQALSGSAEAFSRLEHWKDLISQPASRKSDLADAIARHNPIKKLSDKIIDSPLSESNVGFTGPVMNPFQEGASTFVGPQVPSKLEKEDPMETLKKMLDALKDIAKKTGIIAKNDNGLDIGTSTIT